MIRVDLGLELGFRLGLGFGLRIGLGSVWDRVRFRVKVRVWVGLWRNGSLKSMGFLGKESGTFTPKADALQEAHWNELSPVCTKPSVIGRLHV